jgi:hypothetical protein
MEVIRRAPGRGRYDRAISREERVLAQHKRLLVAVALADQRGNRTVGAATAIAGVGRSTLYEYFDDFEHALSRVSAEATGIASRRLASIAREPNERENLGREGLSSRRLRRLCETWIECVAEAPVLFLSALATPAPKRTRAEKHTAKDDAAGERAAEERAAEERAAEERAAEKLAAEERAAEKLAAEKLAADKHADDALSPGSGDAQSPLRILHERVLEWALEFRAHSDVGRATSDRHTRALMLVGAARSLAIALAERLIAGGAEFGELSGDERLGDERLGDEQSAMIRELAQALGDGAERLFDVRSLRSEGRD